MRPKKLSKKLTLNKKTVANLEMKKVKGGCGPTMVISGCTIPITFFCRTLDDVNCPTDISYCCAVVN